MIIENVRNFNLSDNYIFVHKLNNDLEIYDYSYNLIKSFNFNYGYYFIKKDRIILKEDNFYKLYDWNKERVEVCVRSTHIIIKDNYILFYNKERIEVYDFDFNYLRTINQNNYDIYLVKDKIIVNSEGYVYIYNIEGNLKRKIMGNYVYSKVDDIFSYHHNILGYYHLWLYRLETDKQIQIMEDLSSRHLITENAIYILTDRKIKKYFLNDIIEEDRLLPKLIKKFNNNFNSMNYIEIDFINARDLYVLNDRVFVVRELEVFIYDTDFNFIKSFTNLIYFNILGDNFYIEKGDRIRFYDKDFNLLNTKDFHYCIEDKNYILLDGKHVYNCWGEKVNELEDYADDFAIIRDDMVYSIRNNKLYIMDLLGVPPK